MYWLIKGTMRWYGSRAISIVSLALKSHYIRDDVSSKQARRQILLLTSYGGAR